MGFRLDYDVVCVPYFRRLRLCSVVVYAARDVWRVRWRMRLRASGESNSIG